MQLIPLFRDWYQHYKNIWTLAGQLSWLEGGLYRPRCRFNPQSVHIRESNNQCINKQNKSMFLFLSLISIKKKKTQTTLKTQKANINISLFSRKRVPCISLKTTICRVWCAEGARLWAQPPLRLARWTLISHEICIESPSTNEGTAAPSFAPGSLTLNTRVL